MQNGVELNGKIVIGGGKVTATGGRWSAGIGGGADSSPVNCTIEITGGVVEAKGGENNAGIGGIDTNAQILVSGGVVSATSGGTRDAISGSFSTGEDGNALIYTTVQNTNYSGITNIDALSNVNAIIFEDTSGTVYGSLPLTEALTIPEGSSLIIPEGASLTIPEGVTITMNGNLTVDGTLTIATGVVSMGEGTSDSPYLIPNAATLQDYQDKINNDNTSYGDKHYRLTADIDLNPGYTFDENGDYRTDEGAGTLVTWTPMGNDTNPFSGTFEGNGKTISGLYFNDTSVNCVGLFGYSKGTIQNIEIEDSYFSGSYHVGGICG